jgi:hypothetical protein
MTAPVPLRWSDVVIGAAVRTGEEAYDAVTGLRSTWRRWEAEAAGLRYRLAARGVVERVRGRRLVDEAVTAVVTSSLVDRVVDAQVERVLQLLEREPERMRVLVRGQRDTMVDEVVGKVRAGAAAGDEAVDRFTLKIGRRSSPTDSR